MRANVGIAFTLVGLGLVMAACLGGNSRPEGLDAAIQRFDESTSRVTYEVVSTFPGEHDDIAKQIAFKKGRTLHRLDRYSANPEAQIQEIDIVRGDELLRCLPGPGTTSSEATSVCAHTERAHISVGFMTSHELGAALVGAKTAPTPEPTIAGEQAHCYVMRVDGVDSEVCIAFDGTLLLYRFGAKGFEGSWTATEVSRDVRDADFNPPYSINDSTIPAVPITGN